jgi:hypothetical protein
MEFHRCPKKTIVPLHQEDDADVVDLSFIRYYYALETIQSSIATGEGNNYSLSLESSLEYTTGKKKKIFFFIWVNISW